MRIPSGSTTYKVPFVAVDSTDFTTRETGLSTFTVARSRNGGTTTAWTTPTIAEASSSLAPGLYWLTVDEDTTLGAGVDEETMAIHITATGMAPVTLTIELYRPKFTAGSTLSLADINSEVDTAISDASLATAANLATVDANVDAILVDTGTTIPASITALNDLDAAGVRSAVGLASANLDTQLSTIDTVADGIQTDLSNGTDGLGAIKTAVDAISLTSADIADAVWDEAIADHLTAGSTGAALNASGGSGDPWTTSLPGSYTTGQAGKILADILTDTADLQANQGDWATATGFATSAALATVDANVDAILVDTSELQGNQGNWLTATGFSTSGALTAVASDVTAVLADTNELQLNQGAWATATGFATPANVATELATYDGPTKAELDAGLAGLNDFNPATTTVDVGAINGSTEAATDLAASAGTIVRGAAEAGTLSTTQMTTDLAEVTDDHYNGRIIIWSSGVLKDQATNITGYLGTTGRLTYTATTEAPTAGDTFVIV